AEGVEIVAVAERRGETHRVLGAARAYDVGDGGERAYRRAHWVLIGAGAEDGEEDRLGIGRAHARAVERVRDQRLGLAPYQRPVAELAVVHEHPAAVRERVAVRSRGGGAGRGTHVGEEQVRADVAAEMPQGLVRPRRAHLAVEAGLVVAGVPAEPESVAVDAGERLDRAHALLDERMCGRGDVVLERDRLSPIGDPAAHGESVISVPRARFNTALAQGKAGGP